MSLTQQTWIYPALPTNMSSPYNTTNAILAIKTALDGWAAGHWQTDVYSAGSHLKIRRKGTPAGVLGTFRALVFGRTSAQTPNTPAQDSLAGNDSNVVAANPDWLYGGVGEDIGTAAVTLPSTSNPFPGTKFTGGIPIGKTFEGSTGFSVFLCSCDAMLAILIYNDVNVYFTVLGEIIEKVADGTGSWGIFSGGYQPQSEMTIQTNSLLPAADTYAAFGATYEAGMIKRLARMNGIDTVARSPLFSGAAGAGILLPVIMGYNNITAYAGCTQLFGTLRQVRMGPYDVGRKLVRDTGGTIQAIFLNGASAIIGSGLYLDQNL
jgi:hypothetical protein